MTMKTILIPTERGESMSSALQTALLVARRFDSYIEGFAAWDRPVPRCRYGWRHRAGIVQAGKHRGGEED
jgi:hypothetical protein